MKMKPVTYIIIATVFSCFVALTPCFARSEKDQADANAKEINQLVQRLRDDRLIDEVKGFVVEKRQNMLFIDGQRQTDKIGGKYLQNLKEEELRAQVFPFEERLRMHPGTSIQTLIMPVMFSSPCVDNKPRKPGC